MQYEKLTFKAIHPDVKTQAPLSYYHNRVTVTATLLVLAQTLPYM